MLKVRYPKFQFNDKDGAHWSSEWEYAQSRNAGSVIPVVVEPYLIKVLQTAKKQLTDKRDEDLVTEIDWFVAQESQHFRQHATFNRQLAARGYGRIPEFEAEFKKDCDGFLANKTLKFNIAYSEGFETLGAVSAQVLFKYLDNMHRDVDPDAAHLWKWHLAEEFEHRCVMFNTYKRLYGKGPMRGYFGRIYGFLYAFFHITAFVNRVNAYLLEEDRKTMTPEEVAASKAREKKINRKMAGTVLPRLLLVFSPWYNPLHKKLPDGLYEYLERFEKGGDRAMARAA